MSKSSASAVPSTSTSDGGTRDRALAGTARCTAAAASHSVIGRIVLQNDFSQSARNIDSKRGTVRNADSRTNRHGFDCFRIPIHLGGAVTFATQLGKIGNDLLDLSLCRLRRGRL